MAIFTITPVLFGVPAENGNTPVWEKGESGVLWGSRLIKGHGAKIGLHDHPNPCIRPAKDSPDPPLDSILISIKHRVFYRQSPDLMLPCPWYGLARVVA